MAVINGTDSSHGRTSKEAEIFLYKELRQLARFVGLGARAYLA